MITHYRPTVGTLLDMLTYMRPHGSPTEAVFLQRYVAPLMDYRDVFGNYHKVIPNLDGSPSRILWSGHTDTVHWLDGMQTVRYDSPTGRITLSRKARKRSNCLGADDTAGVFVLLGMIMAGTPGHYILHYGEESGGLGSSALARNTPRILDGIDCAIALDRRHTGDIVTHQYGGRTCSDLFALSLAEELARIDPLLIFEPCRGVYTDTAEYAGIVAECTNLSIGYDREHSELESLDSRHVFAMLKALPCVDPSELFIDREPIDLWQQYEPSARFDSPSYDLTRPVVTLAEVLADDDEYDTYDSDYYLDQAYRDVQASLHAAQRHDDRCPRCHARLHGASECLCHWRKIAPWRSA